MNYKQALAAVFDKCRNPRARSCAVAFLERYANPKRPVTAWHAAGEDAEASALLLAGLGMEEKRDFTVTRSALDPSAVRFGWTDAGLKLLSRIAAELGGTFRGVETQRRVLCGSGDPLGLVADVPEAHAPAPEPGQDAPDADLVKRLCFVVDGIAHRVIDLAPPDPVGDEAVRWAKTWAEAHLADDPSGNVWSKFPPVPPLAVLEALARMEGAEGLPPFQVFDARSAGEPYRTVVRPLAADEKILPAARVNCMPLDEQFCAGSATLDGYFAFDREGLAGARADAAGLWLEFDEPVRPTAEALNFMLDAEAARKLASSLLSRYYGLNCYMLETTRLGLHNDFGGVPGNENLENDDGDTSSMQYRMGDSCYANDAVLYMGGCILTPGPVPAQDWSSCLTKPVQVGPVDEPEAAAATAGVTADELAAEWFFAVHGGEQWDAADMPWNSDHDRQNARLQRLDGFRAARRALETCDPAVLSDTWCGPDNPNFMPNPAGHAPGAFKPAGAFVNGVCAALRFCADGAPDALQFVDSGSHPDKMVAGVWTGLATDLAPERAAEAAAEDVFPNLWHFGFPARDCPGWLSDADRRRDTTELLDLLRSRPSVQFRFGKRTKGKHRKHVILVETNVAAGPYLERADLGRLRQSLWLAFASAILYRRGNPLAAVSADDAHVGRMPDRLSSFDDWIRRRVPDWASTLDASARYDALAPDSFLAGWRADEKGRLVIVLSTNSPAMALRAKLAWRYDAGLPVETAAYAAAHGVSAAVDLSAFPTEQAKYRAVVSSALLQPQFGADVANTLGQRGRFGTIWARDAVWDLDSDECPGRGWYLVAPNHASVRSLAAAARGVSSESPF